MLDGGKEMQQAMIQDNVDLALVESIPISVLKDGSYNDKDSHSSKALSEIKQNR